MREDHVDSLTAAITGLGHAVDRLACLRHLEERIMSAISEFAGKQTAFNKRMGDAVDGIVGDVKTLNDLITKLQEAPGTISPEDQATLDELESAGEALSTRVEGADALTPPAVPSA